MKSEMLVEIILDIMLIGIAIYYICEFGVGTTRDLLSASAFSFIAGMQVIRTLLRIKNQNG